MHGGGVFTSNMYGERYNITINGSWRDHDGRREVVDKIFELYNRNLLLPPYLYASNSPAFTLISHNQVHVNHGCLKRF
jgi:hypothetical protein